MFSLKTKFSAWKLRNFHSFDKVVKIGYEQEAVWNCENIDRYINHYYALIECSRCGRRKWIDISEDYYHSLRKNGFTKSVEKKVPSFAFPEEAQKYGWSLDSVYERDSG
jgi:hypothetical protein